MSFADELKELALTAPKERDTEDVFNEESAAKVTSSATEYEELPARPKAIVLDEGKYGGRTVSRKEMMLEDERFPDEKFELDPDLYDIRGDGDDDDGNAQTDSGADSGEDIADEEDDDEEVEGPTDDDHGTEDDEVGESSNVEEEISDAEAHEETEDSEGGSCSDVDGGNDYDLSQLANNLKAPLDSLPKQAVSSRHSEAGNVSEDVRKGRCIGDQLKVWDKLLEYRIQFQRVLALSNQLPPVDVFDDVMKEFLADPENHRLYRQSLKNVEKAFQQLMAVRRKLAEMYPEVRKSLETTNDRTASSANSGDDLEDDDEEIPSDIASGYSEDDCEKPENSHGRTGQTNGKKRPRQPANEVNDFSEHSGSDDEATPKKARHHKPKLTSVATLSNEEFHTKFLTFRNATINKWYQRTKLGSGTKAAKAAYTALEQPPVTQIEHILLDRERLLERTRTKRSQYSIIGMPEPPTAATVANGSDANVAINTKQILPEIFDDDDFYHHLLREVIERKTQNVSDPFEVSRHWIEIQKLRAKIKRRVDTKASKGRRIRYDVIPKLVSFMTPHDASTFSEQARNELFSSIFGKRPAVITRSEPRPAVTRKDLDGFKLFS